MSAASSWGAEEAEWEAVAEHLAAASDALFLAASNENNDDNDGVSAVLLVSAAEGDDDSEAAKKGEEAESAVLLALQTAAEELQAASEVTGCMSVAPVAAAPNLLACSEELAIAAGAAPRSAAAPLVSEAATAMAEFFEAVTGGGRS